MKCTIAVTSLLVFAVISFAANPVTRADEGATSEATGAVRLEPVEDIAREGERTLLQINNQTPFIVFIYVGGVRVGWIRPYRSAIIRGLTTGYHALYAHSQYGTTSWGPRDAWIPGNWNLIY